MTRYRQLTSGERYALSALRKQGCNQAAIARTLGRHRSTISREVRRNSKDRAGRVYRPDLADDRRSRSGPARGLATLDGDAADRAVMSASAHRIGVGSRRASGNSGARSRPLVGYGVRLSSRSAMRPSTATSTSGVIESRAEACTCISAALPNNAENGTDPTIPEVGWPANVPSVNDPLVLSIEAESATSKPIP